MSVDLKFAVFLLILIILFVVWLTWTLARKRPLFPSERLKIWDTASFGILILSNTNQLQFANRKAQFYLCETEAESIQQSTGFQQLLTQFQSNCMSQQFRLNLSQEEQFEIWRGDFGQTQLITLHDRCEKRRRELELQLFWGGMSHELRTPMTSILSHLEVARSKTASKELQTTSLEIIYQQAQRLTNLVQSTLALGRLKTTPVIDKMRVDIILVAEEIIASLILLAEQEGKQMSLECHDANLHVYGNPYHLKQVFVNVLDNALKYSYSGDFIQVSLSRLDQQIKCEIKDTGSGIPAEHLPQITQQFYRVQHNGIGNGLGLALTKEIIDQHDGQLAIDSVSEGKQTGTTVAFTLPAAPVESLVE